MQSYHQKTRYLKIQGRERATRWSYQKKVKVPEIKLSGLWLAEQGFYPSKPIKVTIRKDILLIQPLQGNVYN